MRTVLTDYKTCPVCKTNKHQLSSFKAGPFQFIKLACGHSIREEILQVTKLDKLKAFKSREGNEFLRWQPGSIQFIEEANGRGIIGHEMGLGKMVISCALLNFHPELLPALIVCKARIRWQWFKHLVNWSVKEDGTPRLLPQVIEDGDDQPYLSVTNPQFPFNVVVTSYDGLWRQRWICKNKGQKDKYGRPVPPIFFTRDEIHERFPFKTIILDEFQLAKNSDATRTQAVRIISQKCKYVIGTSGTPAKNHGGEFFNMLNMVHPELFPSEQGYISEWVEVMTKENGGAKLMGIKPRRWDEFRNLIAPFYLRYTRDEVAPELPKVFRHYEYYHLEDKVLEVYTEELKKFQRAYDFYEYGAEDNKQRFKAWGLVWESMMRMRRIVGKAKALKILEYVEEFLESNDRKLAIFHHHVEVGDILVTAITNLCKKMNIEPPIHLHAGVTEANAQTLIDQFRENPKKRVIILRQLAEGEGLNLQSCGDVIQTERQWNPANEEQPEARFTRPGSPYEKINVMYPVAVGTMDEFMSELVVQKRVACENTYGKGTDVPWQEDSFVKELAKILFESNKNKWGKPSPGAEQKPKPTQPAQIIQFPQVVK